MKVISRKEAIASGLQTYFTGKPCKFGHISERFISGNCAACNRARFKQQYHGDPKFRQSAKDKIKRRYHENPQYRQSVIDAASRSEKNNPQRNLQFSRRYRANHRDRRRAALRKWRANHPDVNCAKSNRRRAAKINATPKWLTAEDHKEMLTFYTGAQTLTKETGHRHEVDHILPLKSPLICGLHVPWNLQILPAQENRAKGNRIYLFP